MEDDRATRAMLEAFMQAWNDHDVDRLMSFMTDDCVFYSSAGGSDGTVYRGRDEVRAGYAALLAAFPDAKWSEGEHFAAGSRAVSSWRFSGTAADGTRVAVRGCDLFRIREGRIAVKDSFRKFGT